MLEDLVLYHHLAANGEMKYAADDLKRAAKAHRELLLNWFSILDGDGQRLKGEFKAEDAKDIDDAGVGQTELMRRTVRYQLNYSLASPPKFLTFQQRWAETRPCYGRNGSAHSEGWHGRRPTDSNSLWATHTTEFNWDQKASGKRLSMSELRAQREQQNAIA